MAAYDLTNKRFGDLIARTVSKKDGTGHNYWQCECAECGNIIEVRAGYLISGKVTQCPICKKKSLGTKKNDVVITTITNNDEDIDYTTDNIIEVVDEDMFEKTPVVFKVVQAINADLSFKKDGHCISAEMNKFFHVAEVLEDLKNVDWCIGDVIYTAPVYNLLTKENRYDSVDYTSVELALNNLKQRAYNDGNFYLAMPKICCGKDGLDWIEVRRIIYKVFNNTDFNILLFI